MLDEIKKRFDYVREKQPFLSDLLCLSKAIRGQGYGKRFIREAFENYVSSDDYFSFDKERVFNNLIDITSEKT